MSDQQSAVSHPSHYTGGGIECKDAMAAMIQHCMNDGDCLTCSHCGASFQVEQIEYDDDLFCSIESAIDECEAIYRDCDVFFCPHCGYENAGAD